MTKEIRVFGPPGCGKTTYLSKKTHEFVESHGPESLLLASFTKTAAAELAGRDLPVSHERIGTLHAHCFRMLGNPTIAESKIKEFNSFEKNPFRLSTKDKGNIDESLADQTCSSDHDALFARYQILRARMKPRERWSDSVKGFAKFWEAWKKESNYMDFTDLIENASDFSTAPPYGATIGIFDEVQDFTPLQLNLIRKWGEHLSTFLLAGDDDQTLYTFTGATPDAFLKPAVGPDQKVILDQSYRVPRLPQVFAQKLINRVNNREPKEYHPRDIQGEVGLCSADYRNPRDLIKSIKADIVKGKSVMVLSACGYMLNDTITSLRNGGIPFHNPYRVARGDWNPLRDGEGSTKYRVKGYLNPDGGELGSYKLWTPTQLSNWLDVVGISDILKKKAKKALQEYALKDNWHHNEFLLLLKDSFLDGETLKEALALDMKFIVKNAIGSREKQLQYIANLIRANGKEVLDQRPNVCVGTIHSVKGGEADIVYLFPDLSSNGWRGYQRGDVEECESIFRQFYVGATRCREALRLCRPLGSWYVKELFK